MKIIAIIQELKILIKSVFNDSLSYIKEKEIEENCICSTYHYAGFLPDQNLNDNQGNRTVINNNFPDDESSIDLSSEESSFEDFLSEYELSEDENILPDHPVNNISTYQDILKNIIDQIYGLSNIINVIPEFMDDIIYSCKLSAFEVAEYRIIKLINNAHNWNMNFNNELYRFIISREDDLIIVKMRTMDGDILTYDTPESNLIFRNPWEIENYWNIKYDCSDGFSNTERFDN